MAGEKRMFTSFEKNDHANDNIVFADNSQEKVIGLGKMLSLPIIQFPMFSWLIPWTTICIHVTTL
jgi:hypothetical protein